MTKSMQTMRMDSQLQAATTMIGKYVTGVDADGKETTGLVKRINQEESEVFVELADGKKIEVGQITNVWNDANSMLSEMTNSTALVGMWVEAGIDPTTKQPINGIVQSVTVEDGQVKMQLYGGRKINWDQITSFRKPYADEQLYLLPDDIRAQVERAQTLQYSHVSGTNEQGKAVSGIVNYAELDEETGTVYAVLYGGERVEIESITDASTREPSLAEMKQHLIGYWAEGKSASGVVEDIVMENDVPVLILHTGDSLAWSDKTALRSATDEEWANYEAA